MLKQIRTVKYFSYLLIALGVTYISFLTISLFVHYFKDPVAVILGQLMIF